MESNPSRAVPALGSRCDAPTPGAHWFRIPTVIFRPQGDEETVSLGVTTARCELYHSHRDCQHRATMLHEGELCGR